MDLEEEKEYKINMEEEEKHLEENKDENNEEE